MVTSTAVRPITIGTCKQFILDTIHANGLKEGQAVKVKEGFEAIDEENARYEVSVGNPVEQHSGYSQATLQIDISNRAHFSRLGLVYTVDGSRLTFLNPDGTRGGNSGLNDHSKLDDIKLDNEIDVKYYAASMRILKRVVSKEEK